MFQDAMDLSDSAMFELRRRLEAYADARLTPGLDATIRMRTFVMNAALRRAALVAASAAVDAAGTTTSVLTAERSRGAIAWRRPAAALVAASLAVAMLAGTVYATKPGGPLYEARLWIETANLPADAIARAEAEINRLDARLTEAQQASNEGDVAAAEAAISAYSAILVEAVHGSAGDPGASAAIEIALSHHVVVLTALADTVPAQARAAVEQALASSTKVMNDLDGTSVHDSGGSAMSAGAARSTMPDGPKSTGPTKVDKAAPAGIAPEKSQKPEERAAPDAIGPDGAQGSPPPGQVGSGGADKGPASRPSHDPAIPERKPARPSKLGDS